MLSAMFSFEGRLKRLPYLGWSLVSGIVLGIFAVVVGVIIVFSMGRSLHGMSPGQLVFRPELLVPLGLLLIVVLWVHFALSAKRLRDIGLSPLVYLSSVTAFFLIDRLVLSILIGGRFGEATLVGDVVSLIWSLFLLLMPGQDTEGMKPDLSYLDEEIARMKSSNRAQAAWQSAPPSDPPRRLSPSPAPSAPQGFGRRR